MSAAKTFFQMLVFPGALYAMPAAWLMVWLHRKLNARLQGRIGPPFFQPFYDFVKLLAKRPVPRPALQRLVMVGLAIVAVASTLGALALLPVFPDQSRNAGDLVLLVALLEVAPLCGVIAGFASRSLYGQIGSTREAVLGIVYSVPFMIALFALSSSVGSLSLERIALEAPWQVRVPALIALALCVPAKLRLNPFSVPNAEQEIYAGAMTEYDGPSLAMWELAHGLEWVALTGLLAALALPLPGSFWLLRIIAFVGISASLVVVLSVLASGTARLKLGQTARFYWQWGFGISSFALLVAVVWK